VEINVEDTVDPGIEPTTNMGTEDDGQGTGGGRILAKDHRAEKGYYHASVIGNEMGDENMRTMVALDVRNQTGRDIIT
jgi:hypothetical protein